MKAFCSLLFALLIITTISLSWQKEKLLPEYDICRLFKNGVKLRKPGTCNEGIICENFKSKPYVKCLNNTPWYSLDSSACVARQPRDSYCKSPCKSNSPTFVVDDKNCNHWYQCAGIKEINKGSCPEHMLFNQKKQMCTYADQTTCVATYDFCDVVPAGIPFPDERDCRKYIQCNSRGAVVSSFCPSGKYFNRAKGACSAKSQANCLKHPYPDEVCGNFKIAKRNKFVNDEATCRGYFFCRDFSPGKPDQSPIWGQCSSSEFFNPALEACQARAYVKCNEDRCDGRKAGEKEISSSKGCQYYLICGDNFTHEEVHCGADKYFDAETSQCTNEIKSYPACS